MRQPDEGDKGGEGATGIPKKPVSGEVINDQKGPEGIINLGIKAKKKLELERVLELELERVLKLERVLELELERVLELELERLRGLIDLEVDPRFIKIKSWIKTTIPNSNDKK
ncbi:hypothetical protein HYV57_02280 [Candidatus Peregrinibacteria bacterium]|nr:hypothetical protein [Candidatus Peregrinibacteria bacterium]